MASLYTFDDVDRAFFAQVATTPGTGSSGDPPGFCPLTRKPGNTPDPLDVRVWWFSTEMLHSKTKAYPMIVVEATGPHLNPEVPDLVTQDEKLIGDPPASDNLTYREPPIWYDFTYIVTTVATQFQVVNELTRAVRHTIFPMTFGTRMLNLAGMNRRVVIRPIGPTYIREDQVYRAVTEFTVTVPLYTTEPVVYSTVQETDVNYYSVRDQIDPAFPIALNPRTDAEVILGVASGISLW